MNCNTFGEGGFGPVVMALGLHAVSPGSALISGARFSKVPKRYGSFLGVTIPFVSQE